MKNLTFIFSFFRANFYLIRFFYCLFREVGGKFYNFDSKLKVPIEIGDESHLKSFLVEKLKTNEVEMFIVVEEDTHKSGSWKNSWPFFDRSHRPSCSLFTLLFYCSVDIFKGYRKIVAMGFKTWPADHEQIPDDWDVG